MIESRQELFDGCRREMEECQARWRLAKGHLKNAGACTRTAKAYLKNAKARPKVAEGYSKNAKAYLMNAKARGKVGEGYWRNAEGRRSGAALELELLICWYSSWRRRRGS